MSDYYEDRLFDLRVLEIDGESVENSNIKANSHLGYVKCSPPIVMADVREITLYAPMEIKSGDHTVLLENGTFSGILAKKRDGVYTFGCRELATKLSNEHRNDFMSERGL